jgi:murein DD-endopeptidase MepM/ murein hydrolase activator NlpD
MKKLLLFILLLKSTFSFAQNAEKEIIEDYWETELSPISDMNSIISFITHDPNNYVFVMNIPGSNPLSREISVNSHYGSRVHPIHGISKFHRGIDLKGINGEVVLASGNGQVIETGFKADLGNYIKVKHKYGFESIYGHLSKVSVKKGQKVSKGQLIGKVGATGKVTGPHLHYTLKKNQTYLDPFEFLYMNYKSE